MGRLNLYLVCLRPLHWVKSCFCLAGLVFGGLLLDWSAWLTVLPLLVGFSLLASAGYVWNDLLNVAEDRAHPRKRKRVIASGRVGRVEALALGAAAVLLAVLVLLWGYGVGPVLWLCLGYLALTLSYSSWLRRWAYVDVLVLSCGFVLRVLAGFVALGLLEVLGAAVSWLLGCTYLLAVLLGWGKRRGELVLLEGLAGEKKASAAGVTRRSLSGYSLGGLTVLVGLCGVLCVGCYLGYVWTMGEGWLWGSFVFVVLGVDHYVRMALRSDVVESPERMLVGSWYLSGVVLAWALCVFLMNS